MRYRVINRHMRQCDPNSQYMGWSLATGYKWSSNRVQGDHIFEPNMKPTFVGPNFWLTFLLQPKPFGTQNFLWPTFFLNPAFFWKTNLFGPTILMDPTIFWIRNLFGQKLFWTQFCFGSKFWFDPNFMFLDPYYFGTKLNWTHKYLGQHFFRTNTFFDPKYFWT